MGNAKHTTKPRNICKSVNMIYGFPGDLQQGWEAERLDENRFMLHRGDGSQREITLNKPLRTMSGEVMPKVHESGVLNIGEWSVIIGRNISHQMHARKLAQPNKYLVFSSGLKQRGEFSIGDNVDGQPVSLVDGHLLKVGEDIIPIQPKKYDITLLVMDIPVDGGYLSYINVIELGNKYNRKDGAKGVFIQPKREGEPAEFVETFNGQRVVTAQFWADKSQRRVAYKFRDGRSAVDERLLQKNLLEAKEVAIMAGIEPEDYHEYSEIKEKLEAINTLWQESGMAIITGREMFEPVNPERDNSRGYTP